MSRLIDLIAEAKARDSALAQELEREFKVLSSRRSFGLNFKHHWPESMELPGRDTRKGDKVQVLPPHGSTAKGDQRLWKVLSFQKNDHLRFAKLELLSTAEVEYQIATVMNLVVVA